MYLVRLTPQGDTIWTKFLLTNAESYGSSVQQTLDGGFIAAGSIFSPGVVGYYDGFLIKITATGDSIWTRTFGKVKVADVVQTADRGYILAGQIAIEDSTPRSYMIKTNDLGDTLWTRQFAAPYMAWATSVRQTSDNGYIVTGSTLKDQQPTDWDIFLTKTSVSGLVNVEGEVLSPRELQLFQNHPNPFNPSTVIRFSIASPSHIRLKVYDILGREVATLVDGKLNVGGHSVLFEATNLSSGVYVYRLTSENGYSEARKLVLIK
jgi:hypothetical protein